MSKLSKEDKEILNTNDFYKGLEVIKKAWDTHYGTLTIDYQINEEPQSILILTTGGWSDNEELIDEIAETWFWFLWWQESKRGGYYKFIYSEVIKYE